jgi:hypothetical protein
MKYLKHINFGSPKFENENNENVIDDLYDIFADIREDYEVIILPNTNSAQYIHIDISSSMVSANDDLPTIIEKIDEKKRMLVKLNAILKNVENLNKYTIELRELGISLNLFRK